MNSTVLSCVFVALAATASLAVAGPLTPQDGKRTEPMHS